MCRNRDDRIPPQVGCAGFESRRRRGDSGDEHRRVPNTRRPPAVGQGLRVEHHLTPRSGRNGPEWNRRYDGKR